MKLLKQLKKKNIYQFSSELVIYMEGTFPRYQDNRGDITVLNLIFETHLDLALQEIQIVCRELNVSSWSFNDLSKLDGSTGRLEPKWSDTVESIVFFGGTAWPGYTSTEYYESITVDLKRCKNNKIWKNVKTVFDQKSLIHSTKKK